MPISLLRINSSGSHLGYMTGKDDDNLRSFELRNKDTFLRNGFYGVGQYDIPVIYRQSIDTKDIQFLSFSNTKSNDLTSANKTVHFYMDDCKFERVWSAPTRYIGRLGQYKQVLSPDFSMYTNMPLSLQIYNVFKRNWCAAYWQSEGLTVIPSITWGDERSFDFCFVGIAQGSVVSVSTLGSRRNKGAFLKGFREMCERIEPPQVICYNTPFDEMARLTDVIPVDYDGLVARGRATKETR